MAERPKIKRKKNVPVESVKEGGKTPQSAALKVASQVLTQRGEKKKNQWQVLSPGERKEECSLGPSRKESSPARVKIQLP